MYARLWWKDARQFGSIWVFLLVAAAVIQALLLHFLGQSMRQGPLGILAITCASLYAFATGAAAFAGEREMGTLLLLDILPINRHVVGASKVSFAVLTTLVLMLVLLAMAAISTDQWNEDGNLLTWRAITVGMIVPVALGWGLFWSAILSNALTAAVVAICCTGLSLGFLSIGLDRVFLNQITPYVVVLWELFLFVTTSITSLIIFNQGVRWNRFGLSLRSPIVVNFADSTSRSPRAPLLIQPGVAPATAPRLVDLAARPAPTNSAAPRSWITEARAIRWETVRQGRKIWVLLFAIGLAVLASTYQVRGMIDAYLLTLIAMGIGLVAGGCVFGLENRARTQQFLTHHGARPGLVWLVKLLTWGAGLVVLWLPLAVATWISFVQAYPPRNRDWISGVLVIPLYFGVAVLCGMAIRRSITAVVVALVLALALTIPLVGLVAAQMLPAPGLLVIPFGLLAVSWGWSADWLFDRPAPRRWVRLGVLLVAMFSLVTSLYAGYRAWSVPDVGPIPPPALWLEAASTPRPAEQNAAELYREAGRRLVGPFADSPKFLDQNRNLVDLLRRAAARPYCQFLEPEKLTLLDQPDLPFMGQLANVLALDARERQDRGDLAGAWDDIVALFHMARHAGEGTGLAQAIYDSVSVERTALIQALEWAVAPKQTPAQLRAALKAYREMPPMPGAVEVVRAQANVVENTLDLPKSRLRDWVFERLNGDSPSQRTVEALVFDLATTPWERFRARRVNRFVAKAGIQDALREPWQRSRARDPELAYVQETSRTALMLIHNSSPYLRLWDDNEVARRALVQILALRAWQFSHAGGFPDSLNSLVPDELAVLPDDPYSGHAFGYQRSHGQEVPALRHALVPNRKKQEVPKAGSWLLYSVGPDRQDDGGGAYSADSYVKRGWQSQPFDIVFTIPPAEGKTGAVNVKDPNRRIKQD